MPTYKFENLETGEEHIEFMSISELDEYLTMNTNMKQLVNGAPALAHRMFIGGKTKPDDGFRDRLKQIKKTHRGAKINTH